MPAEGVRGRLLLDGEVVAGRVVIEDGWIAAVEREDGPVAADAPLFAPGFVDVHVHGWGGHDATGDAVPCRGWRGRCSAAGSPRSCPPRRRSRSRSCRASPIGCGGGCPAHPSDGAEPLGFNLEGPLLAPARKGAHDPALLREPAALDEATIAAILDGLRVITIAPELPGAPALIERLAALGVAASMGHSAATLDEARAGYRAGGRTTTHLFNAMTGIDHRAPGLAVAALTDDEAFVELIADGHHVHPSLWPIITRTKPDGRVILVSDALPLAGVGDGRTVVGGLAVDVVDGRATLAGTTTLAGSTIALDTAVRNLVAAGIPLAVALAAASCQPRRPASPGGPGADRGGPSCAPGGARCGAPRPAGHPGRRLDRRRRLTGASPADGAAADRDRPTSATHRVRQRRCQAGGYGSVGGQSGGSRVSGARLMRCVSHAIGKVAIGKVAVGRSPDQPGPGSLTLQPPPTSTTWPVTIREFGAQQVERDRRDRIDIDRSARERLPARRGRRGPRDPPVRDGSSGSRPARGRSR